MLKLDINRDRLLQYVYQSIDKHRYLIHLLLGVIQSVYSLLIFLFLKQYLLIGICLFGCSLFFLLYRISRFSSFKSMFFCILLYAYLFEIGASFFLDWALGFQNFLFTLIPVCFSFIYFDNNYDEIIPMGIYSSGLIILCYILCGFIDYWVTPTNGLPYRDIWIINTCTTTLVMGILFINIMLFVTELRTVHQKLNKFSEIRLNNLRSTLMLSQIKPHFLYNSLGDIEDAIEVDPNRAKEEIESFARYLRMNIDTLSSQELVSFETELTHVRTYIQIQNLRFENRIRLKYPSDSLDFKLPPLTIQPIVENAINHGIRPKGGCGHIQITSRETPDAFTITIEDDGIGFKMREDEAERDVGSTGLYNINYRLTQMCQGKMKISSTPGVGTTVTLVIPKVKKEV